MKRPFPLLKSLFVAGILLHPALVGFAADANNLLENAGFEKGAQGWGLMVPPESMGQVNPLQFSNDKPHDGIQAAQVSSSAPVRFGLASNQLIPVKPHERYRLSAWVRFGDDAQLQNGAPAAYIRAGLLDDSKKDIPDQLLHLHVGLDGDTARSPNVWKLGVNELPKGWKKIEGVVEIPEFAAYMAIHLFVHGVAGTVFWDSVSAERVDAHTPLSNEVR